MNPFGITDLSFELMMNSFLNYPEIEEVIIFGSRAKGNPKRGSDIDLAIKGEACSQRTAFDLNGHLNEELPIPYYFDVVNYNELSNLSLKEHIDRVGKVLYKVGDKINND